MGGMKFSIRDVLLVTVIAALAVGWWLDRSQLSQQNRSLRDEQKVLRFETLRAQELAGQVILPSSRPQVSRRQFND
jgi:hypothetical protein